MYQGCIRIASCPPTAIANAKRAVDAALTEDLTTGLRIEDQLLRESLAQPVARQRLQAIIDAGAQTRDFELGAASKPPAREPSASPRSVNRRRR
ncbi:hypothetical protein [Mycobacterium gastri]|uniref:Uncharacterized protein n=1 Tax=Mycobacterium gastri TaxID=1777 RepID=A0A1X1VIZ6_MYCGS|nr:hypothetical protein [Mycobacterium gastri]ORV68977.1 hypothetical protein AWC07_07420 [Mycobacterium gastri]